MWGGASLVSDWFLLCGCHVFLCVSCFCGAGALVPGVLRLLLPCRPGRCWGVLRFSYRTFLCVWRSLTWWGFYRSCVFSRSGRPVFLIFSRCLWERLVPWGGLNFRVRSWSDRCFRPGGFLVWVDRAFFCLVVPWACLRSGG